MGFSVVQGRPTQNVRERVSPSTHVGPVIVFSQEATNGAARRFAYPRATGIHRPWAHRFTPRFVWPIVRRASHEALPPVAAATAAAGP